MPSDVFDLSELTHLQNLKRSLVGVGGLEVRVRQCLALTSACYLMIARTNMEGVAKADCKCCTMSMRLTPHHHIKSRLLSWVSPWVTTD